MYSCNRQEYKEGPPPNRLPLFDWRSGLVAGELCISSSRHGARSMLIISSPNRVQDQTRALGELLAPGLRLRRLISLGNSRMHMKQAPLPSHPGINQPLSSFQG
jgi:hypothetical protein